MYMSKLNKSKLQPKLTLKTGNAFYSLSVVKAFVEVNESKANIWHITSVEIKCLQWPQNQVDSDDIGLFALLKAANKSSVCSGSFSPQNLSEVCFI